MNVFCNYRTSEIVVVSDTDTTTYSVAILFIADNNHSMNIFGNIKTPEMYMATNGSLEYTILDSGAR